MGLFEIYSEEMREFDRMTIRFSKIERLKILVERVLELSFSDSPKDGNELYLALKELKKFYESNERDL